MSFDNGVDDPVSVYLGEDHNKTSSFWKTQPVVQIGEIPYREDGPIIIPTLEAIAKIPMDPYPLPAGYEWCRVDLNVPAQ
ncbi:hypothetical protein FRC11_004319, partial [Ceratobasidium sp. 423]